MYVSARGYDFGRLPAPGRAVKGCGCGCSGMGGVNMDGSGLFGTGIFGASVNPLDVSTWSVAEYGVLAVGLFAAYSMFSTTTRGYRSGRKRAKDLRRYLERAK